MANRNDVALAMLAGQAAGGALAHIVNAGDTAQQADLAAAMFEQTGHPTGAQIAEVLRDDPTSGFLFLRKMGGSANVYNMILSKQAAERKASAAMAQNAAVINQGMQDQRVYLGGLGPDGGGAGGVAPSAATGAPAGPSPAAGGPGRIDLEGLARVAAAGGDVGASLDDIKKLRELQTADEGGGLLAAAHVDPSNYTTDSMNAFLRDAHAKAQPGYAGKDRLYDFSLLKRYEKPQEPPSGYAWSRSPSGAPQLTAITGGPATKPPEGYRWTDSSMTQLEPVPGSKASVRDVRKEVINEYLDLRRQGKPVSPGLQKAFDEASKIGFVDQVLRGAASGESGVRALPVPAPSAAPNEPPPDQAPQPPVQEPSASADPTAGVRGRIASQMMGELGRAPTDAEVQQRMSMLGF